MGGGSKLQPFILIIGEWEFGGPSGAQTSPRADTSKKQHLWKHRNIKRVLGAVGRSDFHALKWGVPIEGIKLQNGLPAASWGMQNLQPLKKIPETEEASALLQTQNL